MHSDASSWACPRGPSARSGPLPGWQAGSVPNQAHHGALSSLGTDWVAIRYMVGWPCLLMAVDLLDSDKFYLHAADGAMDAAASA